MLKKKSLKQAKNVLKINSQVSDQEIQEMLKQLVIDQRKKKLQEEEQLKRQKEIDRLTRQREREINKKRREEAAKKKIIRDRQLKKIAIKREKQVQENRLNKKKLELLRVYHYRITSLIGQSQRILEPFILKKNYPCLHNLTDKSRVTQYLRSLTYYEKQLQKLRKHFGQDIIDQFILINNEITKQLQMFRKQFHLDI